MSSSTVSAATPIGKHAFERRVEDMKPTKTDINTVIMDYLIKEGYPDSARKFAMEADIKQKPEEESIRTRVAIRNAIHSGDIQTAIEQINELNPNILDSDSQLHFALLRLQLVELIRQSSSSAGIEPALKFATQQLAPRASTSKEFLRDLERTMALLVFTPDPSNPQDAELLKPDLRMEVADRVNQAILARQGTSVEAKIKEWIRARAWSENQARRTKKEIPHNIRFGLEGDTEGDSDDEPMNGNGDHDAMVS